MNIDSPLVSIVIPIYNGESFLCETIDSCLDQSHTNIEVILVDDCSKDSSSKIIKQYASKDKRIKYIFNPFNKGLMETNNVGLSASRGEYLIVLGHDDKLYPKHIETMLPLMKEEVAFVFCNSNYIDEKGLIGKKVGAPESFKRKIQKPKHWITINNFILSTGLMMRTSSLKSVGGWPTKYRNYGEWLLWGKMLSNGSIEYNESTYALYRRHENNMTNHFHANRTLIELFQYRFYCRVSGIRICSRSPWTILLALIATAKDLLRTLQLFLFSIPKKFN